MSQVILTYNIVGTFGSEENLSAGQLHKQIEESIAKFFSTQKIGSDLKLFFTESLTSGEQTTLDGILSAHQPVDESIINYSHYYINKTDRVNAIYKKFASFKFEGTSAQNMEEITSIQLLSSIEDNNEEYDVRIFDIQNNTVICEKTNITGNTDSLNDMGALTNVPAESSIFEVQAKKSNGKSTNVTINQFTFYM